MVYIGVDMKFLSRDFSNYSNIPEWHMWFLFDQDEEHEFYAVKTFVQLNFLSAKLAWTQDKGLFHIFTTKEEDYLFGILKWGDYKG